MNERSLEGTLNPTFHREETTFKKECTDMEDNTNREKQFQLTSAVIEARRSILQELPFDELCDILRNQTKEPQEVVGRASRAEKKKLIDHVIERMVKNYNLVTEERYAFCSLVV